MGAHAYVEWEWAATAEAAVQALRAQGTHVVALETALRSIAHYSVRHIVLGALQGASRTSMPSRVVHARHMHGTRTAHARYHVHTPGARRAVRARVRLPAWRWRRRDPTGQRAARPLTRDALAVRRGGQLCLKTIRPPARPASARSSLGRPPASASLVQLADLFWLAGHTGLVFRIGGETALPRRQELAQRGRRPGYVRSRDSASVALL
eukprot:scaffold86249_cov66-Phaeocystis_antarctica.AAC.5